MPRRTSAIEHTYLLGSIELEAAGGRKILRISSCVRSSAPAETAWAKVASEAQDAAGGWARIRAATGSNVGHASPSIPVRAQASLRIQKQLVGSALVRGSIESKEVVQ